MILITVLLRSNVFVNIVTDDWMRVFNLLENCEEIKEYKAFNGSAQFFPESYGQFTKLVTNFFQGEMR